MAGRYMNSLSGRLFVPTSLAALIALASAGTALASSGLVPCDDTVDRGQEIPTNQLHATRVNHEIDAKALAPVDAATTPLMPARYPETDAAADTALAQTDDENADVSADDSVSFERPAGSDDEQPLIRARVPGVSDGDLARYKRHMYRRDI